MTHWASFVAFLERGLSVAAKLTTAIPEQNFELIRDRIGEILAEELPNQATLTGDSKLANITVYKERFIPVQALVAIAGETPLIDVFYNGGRYEQNTLTAQDGHNTFFIDVYTCAKSQLDAQKKLSVLGDTLAAIQLQRILGVCRAILMAAPYMTLGFEPGFILHRSVRAVTISEPVANRETVAVMHGRLEFSVRAPEDSEGNQAVTADSYQTTAKLQETEKGFIWILEG